MIRRAHGVVLATDQPSCCAFYRRRCCFRCRRVAPTASLWFFDPATRNQHRARKQLVVDVGTACRHRGVTCSRRPRSRRVGLYVPSVFSDPRYLHSLRWVGVEHSRQEVYCTWFDGWKNERGAARLIFHAQQYARWFSYRARPRRYDWWNGHGRPDQSNRPRKQSDDNS